MYGVSIIKGEKSGPIPAKISPDRVKTDNKSGTNIGVSLLLQFHDS